MVSGKTSQSKTAQVYYANTTTLGDRTVIGDTLYCHVLKNVGNAVRLLDNEKFASRLSLYSSNIFGQECSEKNVLILNSLKSL
jgi:hypothetical protein